MKKLCVLFVAVCAVLAAKASYLYWQVEARDYSHITEPDQVTAVNVWAIDDKGAKTFVDGYRATSGTVDMAEAQMIDVSAFANGTYNFYIELMNYSAGAKKLGETVSNETYADMVTHHFIMETPLSITMATPWHGGTVAAPEPTSAVLMLIGLAGLALKRRKA